MKKLYILLLFLPLFGLSQPFGNEWIDHSQQYYTFKIVQEGLYRIDQAALVAGGVPVGSLSSSEIQLFGREKELPIHISDGGDNSLDPGDFILFYAQGNDGWIDSAIVPDPSKLANPAYNLINDTIHYYFTWNPGGTGKRFLVNNDTDFSAYSPVPFVMRHERSKFFQTYVEGEKLLLASGSIYAEGEGFGYVEFAAANGGTWTVPVASYNKYTGTDCPAPNFEIRVTTNSNATPPTINAPNHRMRLGLNNNVLVDSAWYGYRQIKMNWSLPHNYIINGLSYINYEIVGGLNIAIDRQVLTYYSLRYGRLPNANGSNNDNFFVLNNTSATKNRIDLAAFSGSNPIVLSYGSNDLITFPTANAGNWQFILPNTTLGSETFVRVVDLNSAMSVSGIQAINGSGQFTDFSAQLADSALLMVYHASQLNSTHDYKTYRSSVAGGSYNVVAADISELYHQFGGGVPQHPASIRRFTGFFYANTTVKPSGLFLIGKGVSPLAIKQDPSIAFLNQVPTFGYPAADNAITSMYMGSLYDPLIPTGRISTETDQELGEYLDKVIEYEASQELTSANFESSMDWQKQILHFVGGSNASQQTSFQFFMNVMKDVIEDSVFAGNVTTYAKTSSDPLDPTVVAGVTQQISNGVALMNFFGHAAASNNGFEINIDDPSNWNNQGKYPLVIGNSCYNGDIYGSGTSTSENFVIIPNEGAIGFLSSVYVGYDTYLRNYTTELYRQFANKAYGAPLGLQIKKTIQALQFPGQDIIWQSTYSQMALHGDPMIRVNVPRKPEIIIEASDLSLLPSNVTLDVDSIELVMHIRNVGQSIMDDINIEIKRNFPGSTSDSIYIVQLPYLHYDTTISKKFPLQPEISAGINQFTVSVDIPSMYQEEFEETTNNTASTNFFLNIDGISPIWPYNYAVIPYDTVTVKASTINPLSGIRTYRFELDTTDTYDSPQLRRFTVSELGGVKQVRFDQWLNPSGASFPLICADSTVYFWRVAVDSSVLNWSEFSFQHITGKRGWGQDHFFQFKNNDFSSLNYNRTNRLREFNTGQQHQIYLRAYDNTSFFNQWGIDNSFFDYATLFCGAPAIYVGVLDPITLQPWGTHYGTANPNNAFGNGNTQGGGCSRPRVENFFGFNQSDPVQLAAFENMIENEIPDGHWVVIYTAQETQYDNWDLYQPTLYNMFEDLGSAVVNNSQARKPFGMIFKMGDPSTLVEKHYPDTISDPALGGAHVFVETFFNEMDFIGEETTPYIGPAFDWQTVYWKRDSLDPAAADSVRLRIKAYDINQALQFTIDTLFTPNDSILSLAGLVDAQDYPYLRLNVYNQDGVYNTPAQIDRLHVLYSPVPEAAIDGTINTSIAYYFNPTTDTLEEGQLVNFAVDIRNVSDYDMDSLLVHYWIQNDANQRIDIPYQRQGPLLRGGVLRDTFSFSTLDFAGYNLLWVEVNPYINGSLIITDQPEQYHFNNLAQVQFNVNGDDIHPILDVTFNGKHILNGDIIDPNSEILITLKDENPYLIMDDISDTTRFGIYLTHPNGTQQRIPFIDGQGNTIMQWIPAEATNKKFKIVYPKEFLQDGKYQLFVQGTDRSDNLSGDYEYRVSFEVIRESSITHMMNYPNPFSSSTRFVFTLTGTEEPDDIIIQIMTVTGKVIREITEGELGPITIGRNITSYAWDGRDEFGDPLANGVYLYRVKAKINGEEIKHRASGADTYFKEEFGKMYLLR
jgi:hypothetical protein